MKIKQAVCIIFLILGYSVQLSGQVIIPIAQDKPVSIRGLSVVDDKTAWISGTKGTIGITTNGGLSWVWQQIKGFEKSDFRDIEAFTDKEAVIIASGSPAYILKTTDGGIHWATTFEQADSTYFLDAMEFADKQHGFVLGDPIDGKFLLLQTADGGETWHPYYNPPMALKNEAAFAASGTCLRVDKQLTIVTGGSNSRILTLTPQTNMWQDKALPLTNGSASRGAFSVAIGKNQTVIVGGDYAKDKQPDSVAVVIPKHKSKARLTIPLVGPAGYQSSIEYLYNNVFVSTGTSGTNISIDGGRTWRKIDETSYNVCRKAKSGRLILLAGDKGKLALLKF